MIIGEYSCDFAYCSSRRSPVVDLLASVIVVELYGAEMWLKCGLVGQKLTIIDVLDERTFEKQKLREAISLPVQSEFA